MNTPQLILTSVALFAGAAARPVENNRAGDDLRELVHSPGLDDRQVFLNSPPSDSLNTVQLHEAHGPTRAHGGDDEGEPPSPKLTISDNLSNPDPGLESPYIGPGRHLASIDQEVVLLSDAEHSSSTTLNTEKSNSAHDSQQTDYSPMVVPLVFASLLSLAVLGLTIAVVYVAQLLRQTIFRREVWQSISKGNSGRVESQGEKEDMTKRSLDGSGVQESDPSLIASTESERPIGAPEETHAPLELPGRMSGSAMAAVNPQVDHRIMGLKLMAWTYDNWITHFMIALFGFFGLFLRGTRTNGRQ